MATEELTADRPSLDLVLEALDLAGAPPQGLAAVVSWDDDDGARAVLVWDAEPGRVADDERVRRATLDAVYERVRAPGSGEAPGVVPTAFLDLIVGPAPMADRVRELAGLEDPPADLVAHVEWPAAPGERAVLMLWSTPDARGEWSERVMMPLFESGRLRPAGESMTHPRPVLAWARP